MEKIVRLPAELCDRIFASEFEIDTGTLSQELLTDAVELYGEAICFYAAQSAQQNSTDGFDETLYARRIKYYQEKIKRLLIRGDVQQCLDGQKGSLWGRELQKEIALVDCSAREQARTLADHYRAKMAQEQKIIASSLNRQQTNLQARIQRRSKSKQKKVFMMSQIDLNCPPRTKRSFLYCQL